jgi:hypothetical protein
MRVVGGETGGGCAEHIVRTAVRGGSLGAAGVAAAAAAEDRHAPYGFSFSGLKTAVARHVETLARRGAPLPVEDIAASFQEAVADTLTAKALSAWPASPPPGPAAEDTVRIPAPAS